MRPPEPHPPPRGSLQRVRRLALAACLLGLPALGACGGNDVEDARRAASSYVRELGQRDGAGTCKQMTDDLQAQFTRAVVAANPQSKGRGCARLMQVALDTIPSEQLKLFADAEITDMKVDGDGGTFRYTLGPSRQIPNKITVDGRVAKQDGEWRVSCCVPGQGRG
jgi:hypothetical protein